MAPAKKALRTCAYGHAYYKSTDCPTCPVCEAAKKPESGFLSLLSSPARNALIAQGITTPEQLAGYSEKEILKLHGIGKASLPVFRKALADKDLSLKPDMDENNNPLSTN